VIARWSKLKRFHKEYDKLDVATKDLVDSKLQDLTQSPMPPGIRFEKLKGYTNPDIYTIHVNGNYKISLEIKSQHAHLRRVASHDELHRAP
jgi:mRNA-degrading endonuclease RelE of RelBE toxin-antitoxin system